MSDLIKPQRGTPETDAAYEIQSTRESFEQTCERLLNVSRSLELRLHAAEKDARRYRKLKEKLRYEKNGDGMAWMTLEWCVEVWSMSPESIDAAIDAEIDKNGN